MAFKSAMLLVLLLVVAINAQSVSITIPSGTNSVYLGVWSPWYTITALNNAETPFTLTLTNQNLDPDHADSVEFSATSFTFGPTVRTQTFRVRSKQPQTASIQVTSNFDSLTPFTQTIGFFFLNRTIEIDSLGSPNKVGMQSEPLQIRIEVPSSGDLTFSPSFENNTLSFTPNPIVIKAGSLSGEFTWSSSVYGSYNWDIVFNVQGTEADLYDRGALDGRYTFNIAQKVWLKPQTTSPNPNILVGSVGGLNVNSFYISASDNVTGTITVTPQAADLTFSPASVQLSSGAKHAVFNVTTVNVSPSSATATVKTVNIFTSGDITQYPYTIAAPSITTTLTIPKRTVSVAWASSATLTINNITYISIAIPAPVNSANGLTVTLSAANLVFNTSADDKNAWANTATVTFTGAQTSIVVAALAQFLDDDTVNFAVGGPDAGLYNDVSSIAYTVVKAHFITPTDYSALAGQYEFWVGVESAPIPIRVAVSPIDWVSVRPFAPNVKFTPEVLRFRNGTEQQYFTITPLYTNADVSNDYTTNIEYLIDGPNYNHYETISAAPITVNQRYFQNAWSVHTQTDDASTTVLGLHKTYKVWSTVNYIANGEQVSLTPVSPYFSFSPKVLHFHGSTNRILFEATVTGLPTSGGSVSIDYIIGGKDGGLYYPVQPDNVNVGLRPLEIVGAVVSTDERVPEKKAVLLTDRVFINPASNVAERYDFDTTVLASYHVYSFMIRSFALPDHDLTITPVSPHVKFSPSKITLKPSNAVKRIDYTSWTSNSIHVDTTRVSGGGAGSDVTYVFNATGVYAEANFTVEAYAAGTHLVRFELSGTDKDYYTRIPTIPMSFKLVMRPDSEPFKAVLSSSSSLFPSFVVVAVIAAFALVL